MSIPSNIYANRIYSEHPVSIHPLDDDATYYSFISDSQRLFQSGGWTVTNGSADDSPELPIQLPETNSEIFSSIVGVEPVSEHTIEWVSPNIFAFEDLSQRLESFSMSFYLYQNSSFVNWYEFGYVYYDQYLEMDKEIVTRVEASVGQEWLNFSFTYSPSAYDDSELRIIMRANVRNGGGSTDYFFIVHGLSIGQWSETTSSYSMGISKEETPITGLYGCPATEYGIQENSGYYIVENNELLARNVSVPMVYGSNSSTQILYSQENNPSLIIPAKGFFNSSGKYSDMSCEFWMRINPKTTVSRKVFGPTNSDDGVYVRDNSISLRVGSSIGSNSIYQWNRPMIVHVIFNQDSAILMIDGEIVIQLEIDKKSSIFNSEDWIAFYSYQDIDVFDVDCISIYPYAMPEPVAKRRFAWGQATSSPQTVANYYSGKNVYVNFSNSGYDHNSSYPDTLSWSAGKVDNLIATRNSLSSPNYALPEIEIGSRSLRDLYLANSQLNSGGQTFFTFRPDPSWSGQYYMYFDSLSFIDNLSSIYGVFSSTNTQQNSLLMLIKNISTNDIFKIFIENDEIIYSFNDEEIYSEEITPVMDEESPEQQIETMFAFGINANILSNIFRDKFFKFFESKNSLQVYIGGDGQTTFDGKIYRIGITNKKNNLEISDCFYSNGFIKTDNNEELYDHFSTYTLVPLIRFSNFILDISISGSWEEYFPLAKFGTYIKNSSGATYYDLDYMQINFDYSSIVSRVEQEVVPTSWTYEELFNFYNFPVQQEYQILDNELITGYDDYDDLNNKTSTEYVLSTEQSSLKSYITFQFLSDGANIPISSFPYTKQLSDCCFIDAELENTNDSPFKSYLTKFEFIDKSVIFPPKKIDFRDIAAVIHFDIKQEGILTNPINIRNLEICSKSLNQYSPNAINTESGISLYPYIKRGIYYNYKEKNPVRISKTRNPYLYLTEDSGIKMLGRQTIDEEFGIAVPINENASRNFSAQSFQIWIKQNIFELPSVSYPIFEIVGLDETIEFVIRSDSSGKRGVISARDKSTKSIKSGITFYQNGIRTKSPYLEYNEWISLGISFDDPIVFDNYVGYLNIFRGIVFNNISYFSPDGMGKTTSIEPRTWLQVLNPDGEGEVDWEYWYEDSESGEIKKWIDMYVLGSDEYFSLSPKNIYESFVGTSNILFDDGDELSIENNSIAVFGSTDWSGFSAVPV